MPNSLLYIYIYIYDQIFQNEYFVYNVLNKQDLICLQMIKSFQFIIFLVQPCLSQEGQNVFHFDILKQIGETIHP